MDTLPIFGVNESTSASSETNTLQSNCLQFSLYFYTFSFRGIFFNKKYIIRSRFVLMIVHSVISLDDRIPLIQFNTSVRGMFFFSPDHDHGHVYGIPIEDCKLGGDLN